MTLSHRSGIALASVSHISGFAKAGFSHIGGQEIGAVGPSYVFSENFEAVTGYDNAGWAETKTGIVDEDYSTAGLSLEGSQCLRLAAANQTAYTASPTFTALGEVWFYSLFRLVSITTANLVFFCLRDASLLAVRVRVSNTGLLGLVFTGATTVTAAVAISLNTTYHFWVYYKKGTGSNAIARVAWSTDGIKPTSGSNFLEITNGTATVNLDRINLGLTTNYVAEYLFDKIRVDDVEIGNNPDPAAPATVTQNFDGYTAGVSLATLPGWTVPRGAFLTVSGGFVNSDTASQVCAAIYEPAGFTCAANHQSEVTVNALSPGGADAHGCAVAIQASGACYHVYVDSVGSCYFGYMDAAGAGSDWLSTSFTLNAGSKLRMTVSGTGATRVCTAEYDNGGGWTTPSGWGNRDFGSGKRLDGGKGGISGYNNTHTMRVDSVTIRNQ